MSEFLGPKLVNSVVLVLLASVISIPLSIAIGSWAALRREKTFDNVTSMLMLVLAALPEFVVAVGLVILFSTSVLHWLPAISPVPAAIAPGSIPTSSSCRWQPW